MIALTSYGKLQDLTGIKREKFQGLIEDTGAQYKSFDTKVKNKWRHIDNPRKELKSVQSELLREVFQKLRLPDHMYGTQRGTSFVDHAQQHLGQQCIMTLDLMNCYPRTTHEQVHRALVLRFGCTPKIAHMLTKLCTLDYHLPQGAPTSGYLAHLAMWDLHGDLMKVARRHRLKLSFYVDDIAMSGTRPAVKAALAEAIDVIRRHDHSLRNRKKKVMEGEAREITGLLVRDSTEVLKEYIDNLTAALADAAKQGTVTLTAHRSLVGKVNYVASISSRQAGPLKELLSHVGAGTIIEPTRFENVTCKRDATCLWDQESRRAYALKETQKKRRVVAVGS